MNQLYTPAHKDPVVRFVFVLFILMAVLAIAL